MIKLLIKKILIYGFLFLVAYFLLLLLFFSENSGLPLNSKFNLLHKTGGFGHSLVRYREADSITSKQDILFIGPSTCFRGYDTRIFKNYGYSCYNLGSSNQTPLNSYYLLKRYNNLQPRLLIYDLNFEVLSFDNGEESFSDIVSNTSLALSNLEMCFAVNSALSYKIYLETLVKRIKYPISECKQEKVKDNKYIENGYVQNATQQQIDLSKLKNKEFLISEQQFKYLKKISDYCNEINNKLMFVVQPMPVERIETIINYDNIHNQLKEFCHKEQIDFINFNELITLNSETDFYDESHLNSAGVNKYNKLLIEKLIDKGIISNE